jgi:hypothetical protein
MAAPIVCERCRPSAKPSAQGRLHLGCSHLTSLRESRNTIGVVGVTWDAIAIREVVVIPRVCGNSGGGLPSGVCSLRVHFAGFVAPGEVLDHYRLAALFMMLSTGSRVPGRRWDQGFRGLVEKEIAALISLGTERLARLLILKTRPSSERRFALSSKV